MSLSQRWIDEIFTRLTVRYGSGFLARWTSVGADLDAVKADWARELAGFEHWPEAIGYALENLDDGAAPTVAAFRTIALRAPKPKRPALPEPVGDPDRFRREIERLRTNMATGKLDPKDWARRILVRHEAGEHRNPTTLRFAKEGLGLVGGAGRTA